MSYTDLAEEKQLQKTIKSLEKNGVKVYIVANKEEAKKTALSLIPDGSDVMDNTSMTLEETGIKDAIYESKKYNAIHKQTLSMDRESEGRRIKELRSAPQIAIGSFHAVTEEGQIMIASNSGSQLPSYAYGSDSVIFVAGTQKIVTDLDDGMKRIYEHSLPLESERARKAYGVDGSIVRKILIINSEGEPQRISVILVKEILGF